VQRGGSVDSVSGVGREAEVEHEPDRLGVTVVGGLDERSVIGFGEPVHQAGVVAQQLFGGGAVGTQAGLQETVDVGGLGAGAMPGEEVGEVGAAAADRLPGGRHAVG
jgi:hypothetical protein